MKKNEEVHDHAGRNRNRSSGSCLSKYSTATVLRTSKVFTKEVVPGTYQVVRTKVPVFEKIVARLAARYTYNTHLLSLRSIGESPGWLFREKWSRAEGGRGLTHKQVFNMTMRRHHNRYRGVSTGRRGEVKKFIFIFFHHMNLLSSL